MSSKSTQEIKYRCRKFRILVIGRANAGKTTILQRVCDTTEDPEIYNKEGEKMDPSVLAASAGRGEHDIDNEMVFKTNPGFRFHDSRGFEAGGVLELDKVNAFITERSQQRKLEHRLHAIWYCIPVDDSRPFTTVENQFFSLRGTGSVPIIAIFTKFDALDNKAFAALRKEDLSRADAKREAPGRATAEFEEKHLGSLYAKPYPPKGHAFLRDMDKPGADCYELIKQTAAAFDSEVMQQLFVSTQRNSLELCAKYALEGVAIPDIIKRIEQKFMVSLFAHNVTKNEVRGMTQRIVEWFPHFIVELTDELEEGYEGLRDRYYTYYGTYLDDRTEVTGLDVSLFLLILAGSKRAVVRTKQMYEQLKAIIKSSVPAQQIILIGLALVISAEHSYFFWTQNGHSRGAFTDAFQLYAASPQYQAVARAVEGIDVTKSSLEGDINKWKTETVEMLLQIMRDNRLGA